MPVICINPVDEMDATLLEKLSLQNQDIRLFVSDNVQKKTIDKFVGKKAIGDLKDDSHISTASSGAYCGVFLESDETTQRSVFLEAIGNSSLQRIIWTSPFEPSEEIIKENEELIIDNNDDFIVLNKSSGISVQGGTKSKKNLVDIFARSEIFQDTKPFSVHRLDKDTSGVFIMAKHRQSAQLLTSLFRLRKVHKTYLAICHGELQKNSGEWNDDLTRYDNDREVIEKARTLYKVLDKNSICSLVEMKPITGRKHQLRKQLYAVGCPIYGDQKYKFSNTDKAINKNLMLHSYQIKFMINDKKYTYTALLPDYFKKLLKTKRLRFPNS